MLLFLVDDVLRGKYYPENAGKCKLCTPALHILPQWSGSYEAPDRGEMSHLCMECVHPLMAPGRAHLCNINRGKKGQEWELVQKSQKPLKKQEWSFYRNSLDSTNITCGTKENVEK